METVLIVEENLSLKQLYIKLFNGRKINIMAASTYEQTLKYLEKERIPNIILLDMGLANDGGRLILDHLHSRWEFSQTSLIMLMGRGETCPTRPRPGREHILYKPVALPVLSQYLTRLLVEGERMHN